MRAAILALGFALMAWCIASRALIHPVAFPLPNADEQAHFAYTAHIVATGDWWPDLNAMKMVDLRSGQFTDEPNYINHPPMFYWLMALAQRAFPQVDPLHYRAVPTLIYLAALALYASIGWRMRWGIIGTTAYAVLPFMLRLELQGGMYGNDCLALLGGTLACFGAFTLLEGKPNRGAWWLMVGLAFAAVKLNTLILVGSFAAMILLQAYCAQQRVSKRTFASMAAAGFVLLLPYLIFLATYGSPAPNSTGQRFLLTHAHPSQCLLHMPGDSFPAFAAKAFGWLVDQTPSPEMTAPAALALLACWASLLVRRPQNTATRIAIAAGIAVAITLAIHLAFSYQRYRSTGWAIDMMARYYFPLIAAYGITLAATLTRLQQWAKDWHGTQR